MAKKKTEKPLPPVNASFTQLVKESVSGNPKPKTKAKKKKAGG